MANPLGTLKKALELLDGGAAWTNNLRENPRCHCPYSALLAAHQLVNGEIAETGCRPAGLQSILRAGGFTKTSQLFEWNDTDTRTFADIDILFQTALENLQEFRKHEEEEEQDGA